MQPNTEATPSPSLWEYLCRKVLEIIAGLSPCQSRNSLQRWLRVILGRQRGFLAVSPLLFIDA